MYSTFVLEGATADHKRENKEINTLLPPLPLLFTLPVCAQSARTADDATVSTSPSGAYNVHAEAAGSAAGVWPCHSTCPLHPSLPPPLRPLPSPPPPPQQL